jgi:hypothetical protein
MAGCIFRDMDCAQELGGNPVPPADYPHPYIVRDAAIGLGNEVAPEQPHQQSDFA